MEGGVRIDTRNPASVVFWLIVGVAVVAAGYLVWPFLPAIIWAAVFSILLYPWFNKLVAKGWNRTLAALTVTMVPTFALIIPLAVMGSIAGVQVFGYVSQILHNNHNGGDILTTLASEVDRTLQPILTQLGVTNVRVGDMISKNQSEIARQVSGPLTTGLKSFVITVVTLVISLLTMFFMVRDSHHMEKGVLEITPLPDDVAKGILNRMAQTVRSVFAGVVVVSLIQGFLAGVAYFVIGVPGALVWMLVTTVLCMVPLIGAPGAYIPISLSLALQGRVPEAIGLALFGFLVISQVDNFIRPFFISHGTKLHPIPVFFALLGGVVVMGPVGLMAGPMLLTFLMAVSEVIAERRKLDGPEATVV